MKKQNSGNTKPRKGQSKQRHERELFKADTDTRPTSSRRKLTTVDTDAAVTGAPLSYANLSSSVNAALEWANLSSEWMEYRVHAMKIQVCPRIRDNTDIGAGLFYPGTLVSGKYFAGSGASTVANVFAEDGGSIHPEWTVAQKIATWESNPNARLWTACNAAITGLNAFGIQFRGTANASAALNGLVTHDVFIEYDVEFRGRN